MKNCCYLLLGLVVSFLLVTGCGDSPSEPPANAPPPFPETDEEISESTQNTEEIAQQGAVLLEQRVSQSVGGDFLDPEELSSEIAGLDEVASVAVSEVGTSLIISHKDGTKSNVLLVDRSDSRLFEPVPGKAGVGPVYSEASPVLTLFFASKEFPTGNKALILAPYQDDFGEDLNNFQGLLEAAGFEVDRFDNADADLDKFRGSYLEQYDAIYIASHAGAGLRTRGGVLTTGVVTGEVVSSERDLELKHAGNEYRNIAIANGRYALSVPWLQETATEFSGSYIFVNACESSLHDSGSQSLSAAFFGLGAGGYNGYDESINSALAEAIAEKLLAGLTSGKSIEQATQDVHDDVGLQLYAWFLRVILPDESEPSARVDLLDSSQRITEDYFIFDPDQIVGYSTLTPFHGVVGTQTTFEVFISDPYDGLVNAIEFDIDNTGEHIVMNMINSTYWHFDQLHAPTAQSYPRVDTFTWSALNTNQELVGRGSSTFTIEGVSVMDGDKEVVGDEVLWSPAGGNQ